MLCPLPKVIEVLSAEKNTVFLIFERGLVSPQVVPVKVSAALYQYFTAVPVLGLIQGDPWLGGEHVNAGTEVLTMKCHE